MDEVREQQQVADEISNVISNPIGFGQEVDDDELLKVSGDLITFQKKRWKINSISFPSIV
jgi:protein c20orf178 homolog, putative